MSGSRPPELFLSGSDVALSNSEQTANLSDPYFGESLHPVFCSLNIMYYNATPISHVVRFVGVFLPSDFVCLFQANLQSWKAQGLLAKFDKRASHKCYNQGYACVDTKVR